MSVMSNILGALQQFWLVTGIVARALSITVTALLIGCSFVPEGQPSSASSSAADAALVGLGLAVDSIPSGSTEEQIEQALDSQSNSGDTLYSASRIDYKWGQTSLEERILQADTIARVRLRSVAPAAVKRWSYHSGIAFTFDVSEYLKGKGGETLVAVIGDSIEGDFHNESDALEVSRHLVGERDTQWDDREAIVFLNSLPDWGSIYNYDHEFVMTYSDGAVGSYMIDSKDNKVWLPAATSGASGTSGADTRFLLDVPENHQNSGASGASSQPPTITVSQLRARISEMDQLIKPGKAGTGRDAYSAWEYRVCLISKHRNERAYRWRIEHEGSGGKLYYMRSYELESGGPAQTRIKPDGTVGGGKWPRTQWLEGIDKDLFLFEVRDVNIYDPGPDQYVSYSHFTGTKRPLPQGEYRFFPEAISWQREICTTRPFVGRNILEYVVNVVAPAGTLHEAFFDPVLDTSTSAVGADSTSGVLKPSAFTDSGGATTTIRSLTWQSGAVKMNVSPRAALDGQALDFIELDGTVSLSLDAADAAVDAANDTLSWSVDSQPWEDGDKLMLRIRKGPNRPPVFDTSTYAFTVREDAPTWRVIGHVSASDPDAGDSESVRYYITGGNEAGRFQLGFNHGEILVWKPLDYETASSYTLSVEARDGRENGTATATVEITVTDVAE